MINCPNCENIQNKLAIFANAVGFMSSVKCSSCDLRLSVSDKTKNLYTLLSLVSLSLCIVFSIMYKSIYPYLGFIIGLLIIYCVPINYKVIKKANNVRR